MSVKGYWFPIILFRFIELFFNKFENSDDDVVELRRKVTSPKGITQAAIEFLENKDLKSIWQNALGAAIKRAEEISKN